MSLGGKYRRQRIQGKIQQGFQIRFSWKIQEIEMGKIKEEFQIINSWKIQEIEIILEIRLRGKIQKIQQELQIGFSWKMRENKRGFLDNSFLENTRN